MPDKIPSAIVPERSCVKCEFSQLVRVSPTDIQHVRRCMRFPPSPVVLLSNGQPTILPSMHPMVQDNEWCFEFLSIDENISDTKIVS